MQPDDRWTTPRARALISGNDAGGLIRYARMEQGWRQVELGAKLSVSASTISRLERAGCAADLRLLQHAARELGIPGPVLAGTLGLVTQRDAKVTLDHRFPPAEDQMHRRSLLTAAVGLGGTAGLAAVAGLLAQIPDGPAVADGLTADARLTHARTLYDDGRHRQLLALLPRLLTHAHQDARSRRPLDQARLSAAYSLTSAALDKLGSHDQARTAADRAMVYADVSDSPVAAAAAAREQIIVLRHQGQDDTAQHVSAAALDRLAASGLRTEPQRAAYAQLLCTAAYTHATADDRGQALTLITEARHAADGLPAQQPKGRLFNTTLAAVQLYQVSVHWALGNPGSALDAGRTLNDAQFDTAERRARMHTDLARAWWQMGRPEQTADELLAALRASPAEVRDRSSIRQIVTDLTQRHSHASGVQTLRAAV